MGTTATEANRLQESVLGSPSLTQAISAVPTTADPGIALALPSAHECAASWPIRVRLDLSFR